MSDDGEKDIIDLTREYQGFMLALDAIPEIGVPLSPDQKIAALAVVRSVASGQLRFTQSELETLADWKGNKTDPLLAEMFQVKRIPAEPGE